MNDIVHSSNSIRVRLLARLVVLACALMLGVPGVAQAVERSLVPNDDPSGLMRVSPSRIEEDVQPGIPHELELTITNDSENAIDVSIRPTDLGPASDPRSVSTKVEDGEFGAGDWIRTELADLRLAPFEQVILQVVITPPVDPPVGTNLAGISVGNAPAEGPIGTADTSAAVSQEALVQAFFKTPGAPVHDLTIEEIDLVDKFILNNRSFAVWDITFRNDGNVNEHVAGSVDIRSIFGNRAKGFPIDNMIVLRGATRTKRVIWNDLPWIGAFTPEVRVRGDDAALKTKTGPRIVIFSWVIVVVLVAAIGFPLALGWYRRRQEWLEYLEHQHGDEWMTEP